MLSDFRFALRSLRRNPSFAAVAALSIALGIGANTAMFSLADAMLLRPVPVPHPAALLNVRSQLRGHEPGAMSYPDYVDFRARTRAFSGLAAYQLGRFGFAADRQALPEMRAGLLVSGNFFDVFEVAPQKGRMFRRDEDAVPGRDAVTVISHDLWRQDFGSAPDIVGRKILVDGIEFTVVGVAPESFTGTEQYFRPSLYIPLMMAPRLAGGNHNVLIGRDDRQLMVKGRLAPWATASQAAAEAKVIAGGLAQAYPAANRDVAAAILTELQVRVYQSTDWMLVTMLLTLAGVVLLIACANVANLTLSRGQSRSGEIAVRLAIGAGRWRLIRQLLAESLVIAVAAGAAGALLAAVIIGPFEHWRVPSQIPIEVNARLDVRALLYALAAALASAVLFGLMPAIRATRSDISAALKVAGRTASTHRRFWGRNALVIAQVGGSVFLMVVTVQMYRGFTRLLAAPPGFRASQMLLASFDPGMVRSSDQQARDFYHRLTEDARQMPGVTSAALAELVPMANSMRSEAIVPEGYRLPKGESAVTVFSNIVGDGYFRTADIPILQGRGFVESDNDKSPRVAVVNQFLAETYWPGQNPVGKRFHLGGPQGDSVEVVGLARASKYNSLQEPPIEFLYLPLSQNFRTQLTLLVATSGPSDDIAQPLRRLVKSIDSNEPVFALSSIEQYIDERATRVMNALTALVGGMGLLGLALAMSGIYGVMSWSVTRRRREIGIRMAVGADRPAVVGMVLRGGALLGIVGSAGGLALSLLLSRGLSRALFIPQLDWRLAVMVALALFAMTLAGAYIPARRASRLDPNTVLREE
jgi:predicted permease